MQDRQNHHRCIGNKIENTMLENGQVYPADVSEARGIQKRINRQLVESFANFSQEAVIQSGLLAGIPCGTVFNVSLNERMKDETQHFY